MNCRITQESCVLKPSGFEEECFTNCSKAKDFLVEYKLTHRGVKGIVEYLDDILYELRQSPINQGLQFHFVEVTKYLRSRGL